jgi:hypothetical protein
MADVFVNAELAAGKLARARQLGGVNPKVRAVTFETAAADAIADIRRLFRVGAHEVPVRCTIMCDAIAGATDIDLGLFRPGVNGAAVDSDALMDGTNLSAGYAFSSAKDGLAALGVEERGVRTFAEIAADVVATDVIGHIPSDSYDVALLYNSDISAVGTVTVILETIENQ